MSWCGCVVLLRRFEVFILSLREYIFEPPTGISMEWLGFQYLQSNR